MQYVTGRRADGPLALRAHSPPPTTHTLCRLEQRVKRRKREAEQAEQEAKQLGVLEGRVKKQAARLQAEHGAGTSRASERSADT